MTYHWKKVLLVHVRGLKIRESCGKFSAGLTCVTPFCSPRQWVKGPSPNNKHGEKAAVKTAGRDPVGN